MRTLVLIPARGGSTRVQHKNLQVLCGHPLIWWTIRVARELFDDGIADRIVVSTNSRQTIEYCNSIACEWIERPHHLSQGTTRPILNVEDALKQMDTLHGYKPDAVIYLQPTSPLRKAQDIRDAMSIFNERAADAVISVTDSNGELYELGWSDRLRPVALASRERLVAINGAIYIIRKTALDRGEDWYSGLSYAYSMPRHRSLDIDFQQDFITAELLMGAAECAS